ncbi:MAG: transposase [Rhodocyclaceae bacterium]
MRIDLAGGLYHVTSRGDRREDIYLDDEDREIWLGVFAQVCERFNWRCHAWCQMSNHYHVVVETPEANLSPGMRQLNGVYTQRFNRRHGLVGHLFQGRFKGILVEQDAYLLELARYVVLNPVRAGMVTHASEWPWSSYHAMVGRAGVPAWLETDWLLGQFGKQRRRAQMRYAAFVDEGVGRPGIWAALRHQGLLGSDDFVARLHAQLRERRPEALQEVSRAQRRMLAPPLQALPAAYGSRALRDEAMAAAYATGAYSMQAVADHFGVHYSTVSRVVKAFEAWRRPAGPG